MNSLPLVVTQAKRTKCTSSYTLDYTRVYDSNLASKRGTTEFASLILNSLLVPKKGTGGINGLKKKQWCHLAGSDTHYKEHKPSAWSPDAIHSRGEL